MCFYDSISVCQVLVISSNFQVPDHSIACLWVASHWKFCLSSLTFVACLVIMSSSLSPGQGSVSLTLAVIKQIFLVLSV